MIGPECMARSGASLSVSSVSVLQPRGLKCGDEIMTAADVKQPV